MKRSPPVNLRLRERGVILLGRGGTGLSSMSSFLLIMSLVLFYIYIYMQGVPLTLIIGLVPSAKGRPGKKPCQVVNVRVCVNLPVGWQRDLEVRLGREKKVEREFKMFRLGGGGPSSLLPSLPPNRVSRVSLS